MSLSKLAEPEDPRAFKVAVSAGRDREEISYYVRPVGDKSLLRGGYNYNLLPVVLDAEGVPWDIANIYILARLEAVTNPEMSSFAGIADDLSMYRQFLDRGRDSIIDFTDFPLNKLKRPTYRYEGWLSQQMHAGKLEPSTAKRRMSSVIGFYRWLIAEGVLSPANPPWQEREYLISYKNAQGFSMLKPVISTDVSIKAPPKDIPFEGAIIDGGRLRPLQQEEQKWLLEALRELGNSEMLLIHLVCLMSGARIQTALTLRTKHVSFTYPASVERVCIRCGPGTLIDTKNGTTGALHIPRPLYDLLQIYSASERARHRRMLTTKKDAPDQYLFLTQQGSPYYQSKAETQLFNPDLKVRHRKKAQAVRQFITDRVIPYVRKHCDPNFNYRVHDLRASFGMNETDAQLKLVEKGDITLSQARRHVQKLMWHKSASTTDRYLDYRKEMEMYLAAVDGWESYLAELISVTKARGFSE